ncbi:MAG: hypothetical protein NUW14_08150 [Deltaproteobacteria bacterium]|nr:hypothetical protein [Deltaproteobacteria bacterium]
MRKIWILGLVGVLALVLAGCGGGDDRRDVRGPGLVGLDDTNTTTAPLLIVTYMVPPLTTPITVNILSDLASDGDIAFDPGFSSFTVTAGPPSVLFGIDSFDIDLPEFRAFLTFPLDGATGQPVVPGGASIVSADVEVFVDRLDFASAVPTFLDLVQYPFRNLAAVDFNAVPLATRPVFDFFASDVGQFVRIEVTSLMQAAQAPPALVDFQLRFSRDMSVPPLAPSSLSSPSTGAGRTVVAGPRAMEGIVPIRQPATAKPLSPADLGARRR